MNVTSPWVPVMQDVLQRETLFETRHAGYSVRVHCTDDTVWVVTACAGGNCVLLRTAYTATGKLQVLKTILTGDGAELRVKAPDGIFTVHLRILESTGMLLRCTTVFTPLRSLYIAFWPRDLITGNKRSSVIPQGEVHITQTGTRSGLQYISLDKPSAGSLLYFQNLTALNEYCRATKTSLADSVGGAWPEMGFALPPSKENPLPKNKAVIISDVFLNFNPAKNRNIFQHAKQFMNLLAEVYPYLPRPETKYHPWPEILDKGLNDLQFNHACWSHANGNDYLNAYACDYNTPPEIMVQLAVLLPLLDYKQWSKKDLPAIDKIKAGLSAFYNEKLGTVVRWLPSKEQNLDGAEEQLKPGVMDSWYLHHPLLNLGRLALQGDAHAKRLFLDSLPFTIKAAHHFKYTWPVFYNLETLEVIKAETKPGEGGEHDVAGLYAHVMLKAWQLTKEKKYLSEAKKAAKTLGNKKFKLFYQANNTAFAANALLELFIETNDELYLNIAYLCLANILKNVHLWECNYGYAKDYSTFFGVFPLSDAPYTAAYEEQEVFAAIHQLLADAEKINLLPSLSLLLAEFIRYLVQRAYYYYPSHLPKAMLSEKVKTGELDPQLYIALEDIHDGWEQSGSVGQEVYGAGVAFGIVPRHYYCVPGESFMVYIDYPSGGFIAKKNRMVSFHVKGDERMRCRMLIIPTNNHALPSFTVSVSRSKKREIINGIRTKEGYMEYTIKGNRHIQIAWKKK
ncbi:MAG TPA: hypothetical protein VHB70_19405 [Parafilimonas sp.]|nr:hypothetical protein [Parafilimonas sp.]